MTCGRGVRKRQRMLKSDPAECTEELEQTEKCMLPECREYMKKKTSFLAYTCMLSPLLKTESFFFHLGLLLVLNNACNSFF